MFCKTSHENPFRIELMPQKRINCREESYIFFISSKKDLNLNYSKKNLSYNKRD
jgi:hypothetical protein